MPLLLIATSLWPVHNPADSWQANDPQRRFTVAKSTHILHNTMNPSTRQAVEHEAWAGGTRGPGPGIQNQGAVDPQGETGTQTRTERAP